MKHLFEYLDTFIEDISKDTVNEIFETFPVGMTSTGVVVPGKQKSMKAIERIKEFKKFVFRIMAWEAHQVRIILSVIPAIACIYMGDKFSTMRYIVEKILGVTMDRRDCLVSCPRRSGKTTVISAIVAALMATCPGIQIVIFSAHTLSANLFLQKVEAMIFANFEEMFTSIHSNAIMIEAILRGETQPCNTKSLPPSETVSFVPSPISVVPHHNTYIKPRFPHQRCHDGESRFLATLHWREQRNLLYIDEEVSTRALHSMSVVRRT